MNKTNAHLFLPLIAALAEGKTIQTKFGGNREWSDWADGTNITFSDKPESYRIKPAEPKVWYVIMTDNETYGKYESMEAAKAVRAGFVPTNRYLRYNIFRCEEVLP